MLFSASYCMVEYRDSEQNTEIVPATYVKDLELEWPQWRKLKVYDVFWEGQTADKPGMTLEEAKGKLSTIPTFPEGAGYEGGVGYYKAKILVAGATRAPVQKIFDSQRTMKPSTKAMESNMRGIASSSKASSSGVSSDTTSSGRPAKKLDGGAKKQRLAPECPEESLFCGSDREEDNELVNIDDASVSAQLYEEIKKKYEKSKALNKQQQERIDNQNKQLASMNDLLIMWQKKLFAFSDSAVCCALRCCGGKPSSPATPAPIVSNRVDMNTPVYLVPVPSQGETDTGAADTTPLANNPTEENSAPGISEVVGEVVAEVIELPDYILPVNGSTVEEAPGRIEIVEEAPGNIEPVEEEAEVRPAENDQQRPEIDPPSFDETAIEIPPGVKIPESLWVGEFRKIVSKSRVGYTHGSQGDKKYIQDLAFAMWGFETLATHSVTGKVSNANMGKVEGPPKPALEKHKIEAIQAALKKRISEEEAPVPNGAEQEKMTRQERLKIERVRREIGVKISSVQKAAKRKRQD